MKNIFVVTCDGEKDSAETLGFPCYTYLGGKKVEDFNDSVVINWGLGSPWYNRAGKFDTFKHSINHYKSIQTNVNKPKALGILSKVVNTPKMWEAGKTIPRNKLVVYRNTTHTRGIGFSVIKTPSKFQVSHGRYATEYLKNKEEFRVWYCGDAVLFARRTTKSKEFLKQKYACRSNWNYAFLKKIPADLYKQVMKAKKALKFDFGAFDIIKVKSKFYFLENNSAPSVDDDLIMDFYRKNLILLCKKKFKNKFDLDGYKYMLEYPNPIRVEI